MKSKYKVVTLISSLLIILSVSISIINYLVSLNNAQEHLKNQSLPLSLDNIYTDIQKNIIQPYLVSSMMANDTFVHDWLLHEEQNQDKIVKYLEQIKNKYDMFSTFLVSDKTGSYYTHNGFVEKIDLANKRNDWYFDFKNQGAKHEINLDFNDKLSNSLIMFINYKIFDNNFHFLGATGIALKISYIDDLLKNFRVKHKFLVCFYNAQGELVLGEKNQNIPKSLDKNQELNPYKDQILSQKISTIEFYKHGRKSILNTKYIPELDLYLTVEATLDDFTTDVKDMFYLNLIVSIVMTLLVAFIVYYIIKNYSSKLEYLSNNDPLTKVSNRRDFENKLDTILLIPRRLDPIAIIFVDIDNFKTINDQLGHHIGDLVLQRIAFILQSNIRTRDLVARWGGEEFIIAMIGISLDDAKIVTEKLRLKIQDDDELYKLTNKNVTGSFGITTVKDSDTKDKAICRADEAMYISKTNGKNQINSL